jgi:hypothetical protein
VRAQPKRSQNQRLGLQINRKIRRGEENATSIKRRLRFSKKQRESSSLRRAARLNAILAQVADDKAF